MYFCIILLHCFLCGLGYTFHFGWFDVERVGVGKALVSPPPDPENESHVVIYFFTPQVWNNSNCVFINCSQSLV